MRPRLLRYMTRGKLVPVPAMSAEKARDIMEQALKLHPALQEWHRLTLEKLASEDKDAS